MKKKYYYDCLIQALYMMKEFDVKFFIKDDDGDDYDFTEWYLNSQNVLELFIELEAFPCRIYVKSESEHIFEPKDGDLGQMKAEGARFFVKYNESLKEWKEWHCGGYYSNKNGSDIIMRDGKHFFNPKEEN